MASGKGISFAATADGTTMSSEILDDYEEGSYTATITETGGQTPTAAAGASEYKVYRSTDPYFTPDDATNHLATVTDVTYTDGGVMGDGTDYYYKVLGVDSCPPANADYVKRVGEFDFTLVPGTN
jgi:hypothetical protein